MENIFMTLQYLRIWQVAALTGMGKSTIWQKVKDGNFPQPIKLSPRVTVWSAKAVQMWIETKNGGQQNA